MFFLAVRGVQVHVGWSGAGWKLASKRALDLRLVCETPGIPSPLRESQSFAEPPSPASQGTDSVLYHT